MRPVNGALALVALVAACGGDKPSEGDGVMGSPDDVHTFVGEYDGYAVVAACSIPHTNIGVLGRGAGWFDGVEPGAPGRAPALEKLANTVVAPALADLRSVFGVGWGQACTGPGVFVLTNAWSDVDTIIARVGALLKERALREEVAISVSSIPVAL